MNVLTKVSAIVFCYQENRFPKELLNSLYWCDEIILMFDRTTDNIFLFNYKFHNVRLIHHPFQGWGKLKNNAINKASNDWVLLIDSTEVLSLPLCREIEMEFRQPTDNHGYFIKTHLFFNGKKFSYGSGAKSEIKLFNRKWATISEYSLDGEVVLYGACKKFRNCILECKAENINEYIKQRRNELLTGKCKKNQKKIKRFNLLPGIKIIFCFFRSYFIERNFLNGRQGLNWAVLQSCIIFVIAFDKLQQNDMLLNGKPVNAKLNTTHQLLYSIDNEIAGFPYSEN